MRCSGSQDLGHYCRASISIVKKQTVYIQAPRRRGSAGGHQYGWRATQWLHSSDRLAWGELTSLKSVAETQVGLSKDFQWSIYPCTTILHLWKLKRKHFSIYVTGKIFSRMFSFRELFHLIISQFSWAAVRNQSNSWLGNFQHTLPCSEKGGLQFTGRGELSCRNRWNLRWILTQRAKHIHEVKIRQFAAQATCCACGFLRNGRIGGKGIFSVPGSDC